jgi:hypothetical protein
MREGKGVSYPVKQMDEVTLSRSHALTFSRSYSLTPLTLLHDSPLDLRYRLAN